MMGTCETLASVCAAAMSWSWAGDVAWQCLQYASRWCIRSAEQLAMDIKALTPMLLKVQAGWLVHTVINQACSYTCAEAQAILQ